jgi:hypothetical protein
MKKKSLILLLALIYVFFAFSVKAQIKSEDVSLNINPKQPSANETVTATISSYVADLNKALISWSLNGQTVVVGVGKKTFSFKTGESGSQTVIAVKIDTANGFSTNKQITITPASIDVLWEASDSYVPPFYKGKALTSSEGIVKAVALLNSTQSSGVSYNWKVNNKSKIDSSGYGKNFYLLKKSYLDKSNIIQVDASNLSGNTVGSGQIEIGTGNPKIVFYKKDSLLGTNWVEALQDGFFIKQSGETVVVEPYFISPKDLNSSDLNLTWSLGGSDISTPEIKNELSIKPESKGGSSKIKVSLENIKRMFLKASREINVNF